jgi:hypothetical protein
MKSWCSVDYVAAMQRSACRDFDVLAPHTFHPIPNTMTKYFFDSRSSSEEEIEWPINDEKSQEIIATHIWNSLTGPLIAEKNSNQFYVQLAQSQCPLIYEIAPQSF